MTTAKPIALVTGLALRVGLIALREYFIAQTALVAAAAYSPHRVSSGLVRRDFETGSLG
jgi:hypothetical protein